MIQFGAATAIRFFVNGSEKPLILKHDLSIALARHLQTHPVQGLGAIQKDPADGKYRMGIYSKEGSELSIQNTLLTNSHFNQLCQAAKQYLQGSKQNNASYSKVLHDLLHNRQGRLKVFLNSYQPTKIERVEYSGPVQND